MKKPGKLSLPKLEPRQKALLGVLGVVLILWVIPKVLYGPKLRERENLKKKYRELDVELAKDETEFQKIREISREEKIKELEEKYRQAQKRLEYLKGRLPREKEVTEILSQVTSHVGLEYDSIKFLPEKKALMYNELPIEIQARGRYQDLGEYLKDLTESRRLIKVNAVEIKTIPEDAPRLDMKLQLATYLIK